VTLHLLQSAADRDRRAGARPLGLGAVGNLSWRTNNAFWENFQPNPMNELTNFTRATSNLTVAGTTTSVATSVMVNGLAASTYADATSALGGFTVTNGSNTFTATAKDSYGRQSTNTVTVDLPSSASYSYDLNGNLTGDGNRTFAYDDENQLKSVYVTNVWQSDFVYDGKMRLRERFESVWVGSARVTNGATLYVYDGNLVIQERNANNLPLVTYTRGRDLSGTFEGAGGIGGLLARSDDSISSVQPSAAHSYYQLMRMYHPHQTANMTISLTDPFMEGGPGDQEPGWNTTVGLGCVGDYATDAGTAIELLFSPGFQGAAFGASGQRPHDGLHGAHCFRATLLPVTDGLHGLREAEPVPINEELVAVEAGNGGRGLWSSRSVRQGERLAEYQQQCRWEFHGCLPLPIT